MDFTNKKIWGPTPRYERVKNYKRPHKKFIVIAGPCSIETQLQIEHVAEEVSAFATHLRGGTFRAGTYPSDLFGQIDANLMRAHNSAAAENGLQNIQEVLSYEEMDLLNYKLHADCYQVGSRQMQNYPLLRIVGESGKPVFLKRNQGSTLDEWLGAAEHILKYGCKELYLIERGSSTFHNHVRWDLSISMIAAAKQLTDIPIIVDAAHGTGRRDLVGPMAQAGVAAGADGVLLEVHPDPDNSISDAEQAISFEQFNKIMANVLMIRGVVNERRNAE